MTKFRLILALVIVVVLIGVFTVLLPRYTSTSGGPCWDNAPRCDNINKFRGNHNREALKQDKEIQNVADLWAQSMALTGVLKHNPDLASQTVGLYGENVGFGPDWLTVFQAFKDSSCKPGGTWYPKACPGHREILLDRDFTKIGIGAQRDVSNNRVWIVLVFQ